MIVPMVLDGPINGGWFEAYITQVLVPERRHGDVVIMDNLSRYKRVLVRELIEAAGNLALPPALLRGGPASDIAAPISAGGDERWARSAIGPRQGVSSGAGAR